MAPAAARPGDWVVRLGAHRNNIYALEIAKRTRNAGLPAFVEDGSSGTPRTKVRAGPFPSRDTAEAALTQLARLGLDGQISQY
jgi:DedD protein